MDVILRLSGDGERKDAVLMPEGCVLLAFTHDAAVYAQQLLRDQGAQCRQCGMMGRSSELYEGQCGPKTGCGKDALWARFSSAPAPIAAAMVLSYGGQAVGAFVERLLGQATADSSPDPLDDYATDWESYFGGG